MDIFIEAARFTLALTWRMGSVMFISLFGIELLMQMGLMTTLRPVGRPVARLAGLPSEAAVSFLAALGSVIAAHAMAARFHDEGRLTDRQLRLTGVLNTVPFHVKETLTFQFPVVMPLLGFKLAMIYVTAFWLTGILKLVYVLAVGRLHPLTDRPGRDAFSSFECAPDDPDCVRPGAMALIRRAWDARKKMFFRMIGLLAGVTFVIQVLYLAGMLHWLERGMAPMTAALGLPGTVVGPLATYVFSPTAGITFMAGLMNQGAVSGTHAITALMAGGLVMIPVTRLRRTLPRYMGLFGVKNGSLICLITMGFAMLSRALSWPGF